MGSEYCDYLRRHSDLTYAFSCDALYPDDPSKENNYLLMRHLSCALHTLDGLATTNAFQVLYDTGASRTIIPSYYLANLLNKNNDETIKWLSAKGFKSRGCTSSAAELILDKLEKEERARLSPRGHLVKFLVSFPSYKATWAIEVEALVINKIPSPDSSKKPRVILSAQDALRAFYVTIDPCSEYESIHDFPAKLRFFGTKQNQFRPLESWKAIAKSGVAKLKSIEEGATKGKKGRLG